MSLQYFLKRKRRFRIAGSIHRPSRLKRKRRFGSPEADANTSALKRKRGLRTRMQRRGRLASPFPYEPYCFQSANKHYVWLRARGHHAPWSVFIMLARCAHSLAAELAAPRWDFFDTGGASKGTQRPACDTPGQAARPSAGGLPAGRSCAVPNSARTLDPTPILKRKR